MPSSTVSEDEIQQMIEERLSNEKWTSAFGKVESTSGPNRMGRMYFTSATPFSDEPLERGTEVECKIVDLLQSKQKKSCKFILQPGGKIQFDYTP